MKNKIETLNVNALNWFDKVNGNSYFAGRVTINYGTPSERSYIMPYQYGYGDQYRSEALNVLREKEGIKETSLYDLKEAGVICRFSIKDAKKSELNKIK